MTSRSFPGSDSSWTSDPNSISLDSELGHELRKGDPWRITDVTLRLDEEQALVVSVGMGPGAVLHCAKC